MKRRIAGLLMAALSLVCCGIVDARPSPHIFGQVSAPECVDAMAIAKYMYASTSTYVYAPLQLPAHLGSTMVLGATDVDISGGDALPENTHHFENPFPDLKDPSYQHIHWGRDVTAAGRIVITTDNVGWRGDMYSLYVLQGDVPPEQFRADLANSNPHHRYTPLLDSAWRTPLVFWSNTTGKPWFIIVDEPYEPIGQWEVYLASGDGFKSVCRIKFWPRQGRARAPRILPGEVRKLAELLDQTLGYSPEEGTLQPIAGLRMYSQHIWRNVAYRPWALSDKDTYNSKDQVDYGLLQWSRTGPSYARLYARIKRAYPVAELALARYYESQFMLPRGRAKKVAHWILDVAYRSNFLFSGGTPFSISRNDVNPNPWVNR
jgi:hypothetical protein